MCSRAIIISGGKLVADSSIENLKNSIGSTTSVFVTFDGEDPTLACEIAKKLEGVSNVSTQVSESGKNQLVISIKGDVEIRPQLVKNLVSKGFGIYEIAIQKNSLEDVFHTLTEAK